MTSPAYFQNAPFARLCHERGPIEVGKSGTDRERAIVTSSIGDNMIPTSVRVAGERPTRDFQRNSLKMLALMTYEPRGIRPELVVPDDRRVFSGAFLPQKGARIGHPCGLADRFRAVQNAEPLADHHYSLGAAGLVILVLPLVGAPTSARRRLSHFASGRSCARPSGR